jgi:hypothetical protein
VPCSGGNRVLEVTRSGTRDGCRTIGAKRHGSGPHDLSGSLGFNYQWGFSEQRLVSDIEGNELTRTKVKVSTIGILYSVSYVF